MFNSLLRISLLALFALGNSPAFSDTETFAEFEATLPNGIELVGGASYIVEFALPSSKARLNGGARATAIRSAHQRFVESLPETISGKTSESFSLTPTAVVTANEQEVKELRLNPLVKNVYPNRARRLHLAESLNVVLPGRAHTTHTGKGQAIAIIDTGVDSNHDFFITDGESRVVSEACYTYGDFSGFRELLPLCPGFVRQSVAPGSGIDCTRFGIPGCDHGTHVAGIAAGNDGVAREAQIIAIQAFTGIRDVFRRNICGSGIGQSCVVAFDSDLIRALERVYALRNTYDIASVNMSLGGGQHFSNCNGQNPILTSVVERLREAGIATVVSSGNNGFSSSISFPACITNAIAVGATSDFTGEISDRPVVKDQRVFYSNHSGLVDMYAPGSLVRSSIPGNRFANFNGTSMAAPHVAGAFAVIKAENNDLTVEDIELALEQSGPAVPFLNTGIRRRINIAAALRSLNLFRLGFSLSPMLMLLEDAEETD